MQWINEDAVSQLTGMSLSTLRSWRFKGLGPAYSKVGRSVRYGVDDVEHFMLSHKVQNKKEN